MQPTRSNPPLAFAVRSTFLAFVVLLIFGSGLLWMPGVVRPHWPWPIAPFNAAFLGGVYLAELVAGLAMAAANRWAPARVVLPMSLAFIGVVSLVTLRYLGRFDYQKVATYAWFVAYGASMTALALFQWRYRRLPPASTAPVPPVWQFLLGAQAAVLGLYGLLLIVAPTTGTRFWPWRIDSFHAQVYSAIFLSGCAGAFFLARAMAPIEAIVYGTTQACFAVASVVGLAAVDATQHRVQWAAAGTRGWLAGCAALLTVGVAVVGRGVGALTARSGAGRVSQPRMG